MSVTPRQMMACAASMMQSASDEAHFRSVCSRAYYAAFQAGYAYHVALPAPGTVGTANGRHEQLIAQLSNPTFSKGNQKYYVSQALGKTLRFLADARVRADYFISLEVDRDLAVKVVEGAQEVVDKTP